MFSNFTDFGGEPPEIARIGKIGKIGRGIANIGRGIAETATGTIPAILAIPPNDFSYFTDSSDFGGFPPKSIKLLKSLKSAC